MEFKIWGRRGYQDCPSQPLKYMMEDERVAAVVMIDRRQSSNIDEFMEHVSNNTEFRCLGIKEIPILDGDMKYFISFHSDSRYRSPRMMINIYLHIPSK